MGNSNAETTFLKEFKEFTVFLQGLWGILTGISVFFPLSNALTGLIPLGSWAAEDTGNFVYLGPELVTALTSFTVLFFVLWTFGQRRQFRSQRNRRLIQRRALSSFVGGVLALIAYLAVTLFVTSAWDYLWFGWEYGDPQRLLSDIVLLISYGVFFVLMTRAFMLLGMIEFFGRKS
jgi:hypothetical protein